MDSQNTTSICKRFFGHPLSHKVQISYIDKTFCLESLEQKEKAHREVEGDVAALTRR